MKKPVSSSKLLTISSVALIAAALVFSTGSGASAADYNGTAAALKAIPSWIDTDMFNSSFSGALNTYDGHFYIDSATNGTVNIQTFSATHAPAGDFNVPLLVGGGHNDTGDVTNNRVVLDGGEVDLAIVGGAARSGKASGNVVDIRGGSVNTIVLGVSPAVGGNVYGGYVSSGTRNAEGNTVNISGGTIADGVFGGYIQGAVSPQTTSGTGDARANEVRITGGAVGRDVFGGRTDNTNAGNAVGNTVEAVTGVVAGDIIGGRAEAGDATGNSVKVTGAGLGASLIQGGHTVGGVANDNTVTLTGTGGGLQIKTGFRGGGGRASASNNSLTLSGRAETTTMANQFLVGGEANAGAAAAVLKADGNTIILEDAVIDVTSVTTDDLSIIGGNLVDGVSIGAGSTAIDNTVTISGDTSFATNPGKVWIDGGRNNGGPSGVEVVAGNTLNLNRTTEAALLVNSVRNFQNVNFTLAADTAPDDVIVRASGAVALGGAGVIAKVTVDSGSNTYDEGDVITLFEAEGGFTATGFATPAQVRDKNGSTFWEIAKTSNSLTATMRGVDEGTSVPKPDQIAKVEVDDNKVYVTYINGDTNEFDLDELASLKIVYGASKFYVETHSDESIRATARDGAIIDAGATLEFTAASLTGSNESYILPGVVAIINGKTVITVDTSSLPPGMYDISYTGTSGADGKLEYSGLLFDGFAKTLEPTKTLTLTVSLTTAGDGILASAYVKSGDESPSDIDVTFSVFDDDRAKVITDVPKTTVNGHVETFYLVPNGLASGRYIVTATTYGFGAGTKTISVGKTGGSSGGGCDSGLGWAGIALGAAVAATRRKRK